MFKKLTILTLVVAVVGLLLVPAVTASASHKSCPSGKGQVVNKSYTTSTLLGGESGTFGNLRGNTNQGDTVTANFDIHSACSSPVRVSLVSYKAVEPYWNPSTANQQELHQSVTMDLVGSGHSMTVSAPDCNYQVDFVWGDVIETLDYGNFYSTNNRLISADNDGENACVTSGGLPETPVDPPVDPPTDEVCVLVGVELVCFAGDEGGDIIFF